MESRAGLELSGGRADAGVALTSQQQQRDQRVGYKRKRSANVAEVGQGKKARACEDDSESERQVRGPSPTGMESRAGLELSCGRADAGAAPTSRRRQQQQLLLCAVIWGGYIFLGSAPFRAVAPDGR